MLWLRDFLCSFSGSLYSACFFLCSLFSRCLSSRSRSSGLGAMGASASALSLDYSISRCLLDFLTSFSLTASSSLTLSFSFWALLFSIMNWSFLTTCFNSCSYYFRSLEIAISLFSIELADSDSLCYRFLSLNLIFGSASMSFSVFCGLSVFDILLRF